VRTLFAALLLATLSPPQAASLDSAAFSVGYFEVSAANRSAAVTALGAYRQSSRREQGSLAIEMFEQENRPGHFVTIESWTTEAALEAHGAGAAAMALQQRLKPMLLSPPDVRPYKALRVKAVPAVDTLAVYVITQVDVAPAPDTDPSGLLARHADDSRADGGNLRFDVLQHAMRANHFTVIEEWRDVRAHEAHSSAAHTLKYRADLQPLAGSPIDEQLYHPLP